MKKKSEIRNLDYYLSKRYPFLIYPAEEGGYVAEIEELPGCMTQGETLEEVSKRIEDARRVWIEVAYEGGMEIPLSRTEEEYSGKFLVRLPKYLHRRLSEEAMREGVSLNQCVVAILSAGVSINEMVSKVTSEVVERVSERIRQEQKPMRGFGIVTPGSIWGICHPIVEEEEEKEPVAA
ncbi:hypothetical protein ES703_32071 [subsurface metagenome]|jgi:predicted RNase H-like HicB family nuclease